MILSDSFKTVCVLVKAFNLISLSSITSKYWIESNCVCAKDTTLKHTASNNIIVFFINLKDPSPEDLVR